ncbi:MAG: heavy metal translocating P-type ATPase, partial [Chitinophagaceae bacterium]
MNNFEKKKKSIEISADTKKTFPILGMSCASCALSVESSLRQVPGVQEARVNYANQTAWVAFNPQSVEEDTLRNAVRSGGYDLILQEDPQGHLQEEQKKRNLEILRNNMIGSASLSIPVLVIAMLLKNDIPYANDLMMVICFPVVFYFGRSFFRNGILQIRKGKANMDTLVALSTGMAFLFSTFNTLDPQFWIHRGIQPQVYFEAAAMIITFILLGKWLEERAKSQTSSALKKLMGLTPKTVLLIQDGKEQEVPLSGVVMGQVVVVRPGERIPLDGVVTMGNSFVQESMITGEPMPKEKKEGDQVFAGTLNQQGSFRIRAEKLGGETVLGQIIRMVQQAQGSKAPVQKLTDRIAGIFVPVVLIIAGVTFGIWMMAGGVNGFTHGLLAAVTVLVIACPCALGLATPTAIMVAVGKGAENQILIRDAESLESAHQIKAIVFDKTGTITQGEPEVTDLFQKTGIPSSPAEKDPFFNFLGVILAMELQNTHPLATSITQYLRKKNYPIRQIEGIENITGKGIEARVEQHQYRAGNERFMVENQVRIGEEIKVKAEKFYTQAKTVVFLAKDQEVWAIFGIADQIKPHAQQAIATLIKKGISVYLVTGDHAQTAKIIAEQAGITEFRADALPADKAEFVKNLQSQGKKVAMVGDGINDSHAMAQADLSMAMGKGADIAMEVSGITMINSDINLIPLVFLLSEKTVRTIHQNLFWAFFYNLIGIPIAAGILYPFYGFLLNPMVAGAAMAMSSVSVVTNSLRLKKI